MTTIAAVAPLAEDAARRLTERIRITAHNARDNLTKLRDLVDEAQHGQAHLALGYASWTAYLSDVLGDEPLRLARDQRQELVGYLAGEGMSTRAIAPIVGVSQKTVVKDAQVIPQVSPAPAPKVNTTTGEVSDDFEPEPTPLVPPAKVTGLDGKQYTRPVPAPEPKAPPRRALTAQFFDATYDLGKAIERVARLADDDRLPQNADQVAARHRNDLIRYRDLLQEVIDQLPTA